MHLFWNAAVHSMCVCILTFCGSLPELRAWLRECLKPVYSSCKVEMLGVGWGIFKGSDFFFFPLNLKLVLFDKYLLDTCTVYRYPHLCIHLLHRLTETQPNLSHKHCTIVMMGTLLGLRQFSKMFVCRDRGVHFHKDLTDLLQRLNGCIQNVFLILDLWMPKYTLLSCSVCSASLWVKFPFKGAI